MIAGLERELAGIGGLLPGGALDPRVRSALERVPRHEFVAAGDASLAYADGALHIGYGQTISQPLIVGLMTGLLAVGPDDVVLEVGTGCGYQAAVLSEIVSRVYTVEIVPELAAPAAARLARLGYDNVAVREGDGAEGWPEHAPFGGIVVTAAAPRVPPALAGQLAPGRRLVVPLGSPAGTQQLTVLEKRPDGGLDSRPALAVRFVPLTGPGARRGG